MAIGRKIGVFICHCGGNISDYVDVARVAEAVASEPGVVVSKNHMFTCSDAAQQEMIDDIKELGLDGLVIASCSPKLHMFTFRGMAERGGINQYQYVHVNLREQCSWAHTNDKIGATEKGIALVRAGIAKAALSTPLTALRVDTIPKVLVIGGGVSGLRAALALSDMGLSAFIVERQKAAGGAVKNWGRMAPDNQRGSDIVKNLLEEVNRRENIMLYTDAEMIEKKGYIGDFQVTLRVGKHQAVQLQVGAMIVATGYDNYQPAEGEFGYGREGVVTLPEFRDLADRQEGALTYKGNPVKNVAFIYCVGSRQKKSETCPEPNQYCSRYCCNAGTHMAVTLEDRPGNLNQYHLYRDIRTYGHNELIYEEARRKGAVFMRYPDQEPPVVSAESGGLNVMVKDQLMGGELVDIPVDLVVLVTGMVPKKNETLMNRLKLPVSKDGFLNELHIKLRPVETVIDGVFIAGSAQSPKTMAESVGSALAAVSKSGGLLMKGYVDLEPLVANVDTDRCIWCDECLKACPYGAIERIDCGGKEVALVVKSLCKGEGACVPICPHDAIEVEGYTDRQITAMIDACSREVVEA
ncbi:CoB--CoM heterodisulfide reductase iron-sulfur subunit A family protein [Pontiella sp.]|uniref:CoB--CoM heterodisulfide reductase iron-sulfur subunit A family protein n=1 Tax=Pontiella sp. TaxID=2837462 RepID=UPI0035667E23